VLPCRHRALDGQEEEAAMLEELLLAALHMYKVGCKGIAAAAVAFLLGSSSIESKR
jgi:hypothetical protein